MNSKRPLMEWDEAKRRSNLYKHRLDFIDISSVFDDREFIEVQDTKQDYGEIRFNRYTHWQGRLIHVSYTIRNGVYRLISARKANERERKSYEKWMGKKY